MADYHKECLSALPVELLQKVLSYMEVPVCKSCSNRFETDLSISNNYRNPHRLPVGCTTCPGFVCFGCVYISYSKCYCFLSSQTVGDFIHFPTISLTLVVIHFLVQCMKCNVLQQKWEDLLLRGASIVTIQEVSVQVSQKLTKESLKSSPSNTKLLILCST